MAAFGRSLKPSSFLMSGGKRPGMPSRSMSGSSLSSVSSNDDGHHMHFVLSGHNTPISENVPASNAPLRSPTAFAGFDRGPTASPHSPRSQPISIELPSLRRFGASPAYTPPEPLSARGDVQGGYFPNHEDPTLRVRRPHPFQLDVNKNTRHQSAQPALDKHQRGVPQATMASAAVGAPFIMSDSAQHHPLRSAIDGASSRLASQSHEDTPVSSYMPSGGGDYQLPMGKYYPSNYENRNNRSGPPTRNTSHLGPAPLHFNNFKSDSQVPRLTSAQDSSSASSSMSKHSRSASEARRRLQQYQRDMVAQAQLAANKVLGAHGSRPQPVPVSKGSTAEKATSSSSSTSTIRNLHLPGSSMLAAAKPTSPRLQPLGSPGGIVTPMDLGTVGGEDGGYLSRGQPMSGPDAAREQDEVTRALSRADDERRRQGVSSPSAIL